MPTQVGRGIPRLEARQKVTGRAEYVHNLHLPGMLHGKIFRSTVPHGRIRRIDPSAARALAGVHRVVTIDDDLGKSDDVSHSIRYTFDAGGNLKSETVGDANQMLPPFSGANPPPPSTTADTGVSETMRGRASMRTRPLRRRTS